MSKVTLDTRELDRIIGNIERRKAEVCAQLAAKLEDEIKQQAPEEGGVRDSIYVQTESSGDVQAIVGTDSEAAADVEFGDSRTPARPFFTPAVEAFAATFNDPLNWEDLFK